MYTGMGELGRTVFLQLSLKNTMQSSECLTCFMKSQILSQLRAQQPVGYGSETKDLHFPQLQWGG